MACFDYEEVECTRCNEKFMDGYNIIDEQVVCDECLEATDKLVKIEKFGCFYNPDTKTTHPANVDGTPDLFDGMAVHIDDIICDEREEILTEINRIMGEQK